MKEESKTSVLCDVKSIVCVLVIQYGGSLLFWNNGRSLPNHTMSQLSFNQTIGTYLLLPP